MAGAGNSRPYFDRKISVEVPYEEPQQATNKQET